jgi:hypothetical protein
MSSADGATCQFFLWDTQWFYMFTKYWSYDTRYMVPYVLNIRNGLYTNPCLNPQLLQEILARALASAWSLWDAKCLGFRGLGNIEQLHKQWKKHVFFVIV